MSSEPISDLRPLHCASAFVLILAGVICVLTLLARAELGEPHWSAFAKPYLVAGAAVFCLQELAALATKKRIRSYFPAALTVPAAMVLSWFASLHWFAAIAVYLVLTVAWMLGGRSMLAGLRNVPRSETLFVCILGIALGVAYFLIMNTNGQASVLAPESALVGIQNHDTLYHSAIAAILAKFGKVSTGLDGLVPLNYHVLSHFWLGHLARWLGVPSIHAYYIGTQIIWLPLLFFGMMVSTYWLWKPARIVSGPVLLVIVPLALLSLVDMQDWASYLISESYLLSLVLLMTTFPLIVEIAERPLVEWGAGRLFTLILATAVMAMAKVSVGAIFASGVAAAAVFSGGMTIRRMVWIGIPAAAALAALLAVFAPLPEDLWSLFGPLHFVKTYPDGAWSNIAAIACLFAAAAAAYWMGGRADRVLAGIVAVLGAASLFPIFVLRWEGGSVYYFVNVAVWIAVPFIAGHALLPLAGRVRRAGPAIAAAGGALLLAIVAAPFKIDSVAKFDAIIATLQLEADGGAAGSRKDDAGGSFNPLRTITAFQAMAASGFDETVGGRLRQTLQTANISDRTDTLVFVSPNVTEFWRLPKVCRAAPFAIPALFNLPMISGLPPMAQKCQLLPYYGYERYLPSSHSSDFTQMELCKKALTLGFKKVFTISGLESGKLIDCSAVVGWPRRKGIPPTTAIGSLAGK